ncbi:MAG: nitroreductase family protein [Candidatus Alcyoniella australis]|nr:nitroreductase family protein [Candidatus Alcyoniella australis]
METVILDLLRDCRPASELGRIELGDSELRQIVESARLAPSANNVQPWRFNAFRDPLLIAEAARAVGLEGLADAGALIATQAREGLIRNRWKQQPFAMIDVPIACLHILLAATQRNLGTRLVLDFDKPQVKKLLSLDKQPLLALIFIGRPLALLDEAQVDCDRVLHVESF